MDLVLEAAYWGSTDSRAIRVLVQFHSSHHTAFTRPEMDINVCWADYFFYLRILSNLI